MITKSCRLLRPDHATKQRDGARARCIFKRLQHQAQDSLIEIEGDGCCDLDSREKNVGVSIVS